jgi:segregation and condensation protein A
MAAAAKFDADEPVQLLLDLDGFEGPIDVLLALAREQKVDLAHIKIVPLADQYLAFIAQARHLRLEIAADYLVMAAWLAYLKSRLLLPEPPEEPGPSADELAADLAFQLLRLEAMQGAGRRLMGLARLGIDIFTRGIVLEEEPEPDPETDAGSEKVVWEVTLYDLLRAYADQHQKQNKQATLKIVGTPLHSVEDALRRFTLRLPRLMDWEDLMSFLPLELLDPAESSDPLVLRSALASTFAACLELTKAGRLELRQSSLFGPIELRGRDQGVEATQ